MVEQKFHHYALWEDHQAGFYGRAVDYGHVRAARDLLAAPAMCEDAMRRVLVAWPVSAEQNLTDRGLNRRAWLGQAACCLATGASAASTKRAWWQLTEDEQACANKIADAAIADWESGRLMDGWS
jgi:hypothetical protein